MTIQEKLTHIVETKSISEIVTFLKSLSAEERKNLVPSLKKLHKYYSEYIATDNRTYSSRGTTMQWNILAHAFFVCYDLKEFEKTWRTSYILKPEVLYSIIEWYKPSWFGDLINNLANIEWAAIDYEYLMELADKGLVQPSAELVAKTLPLCISKTGDKERFFTSEILEKRAITLDEHIWFLFDYEGGINWIDKWKLKHEKEDDMDASWMGVFKKYSENGRISRKRLLEAALAASTRNFTKTLCGWFADLFAYLQPSTEELLDLQPELMSVLAAPQSKPINIALGYLKKICTEPLFNTDEFIQQVPVLLSSEVKSIHTATLGILESLARKNKDRQDEICIAATQAFISKDVAVQTKAAKLIAANGNKNNQALYDAINIYESSLLAAVKEIVRPWLQQQETPQEEHHELPVPQTFTSALNDDNKIPLVQNVEELIFLMSQALDNNKHYHLEHVLSGILQFHPQITVTHFQQMEPAFQRAFKVIMRGASGNGGQLENLLSVFMIEYGLLLQKQLPEISEAFDKQFKKAAEQDAIWAKRWQHYKLQIRPVKEWVLNDANGAYEPFKQLALTAIQNIRLQKYLPLLSLPTHEGGWIDPETLAQRLATYQTADIKISLLDMQIAISRTAFENTDAALQLSNKTLQGEYKELMQFLLDRDADPKGNFEHPAWWMMAGLTKAPEKTFEAFADFPYTQIAPAYLTGKFNWKTYSEKYLAYGKYNLEKKSYDRYEDYQQRLRILFPDSPNVTIKNESYGGTTIMYDAGNQLSLLPEYIHRRRQFSENDAQRIISLMPNHPDVILANIISRCMDSAMLAEATEKRMVQKTLEALHILKNKWSEMSYLFVATAMLNSDSTNRTMAAEIWIDRVQQGSIDSEKTGAIIGTHQQIEWAPLKRFTDLVANHMQKISALHDKELEKMLTACLLQLPAKGIKDLKKLLEIFHEVVVTNSSAFFNNAALVDKLMEWNNVPAVKKAAMALIKI